jgi:hypothetical protein
MDHRDDDNLGHEFPGYDGPRPERRVATAHRAFSYQERRRLVIRRRRVALAVALAVTFVVLLSGAAVLFASCGKGHASVRKTGAASPSPSVSATADWTELRRPTQSDPLRFMTYGESVGDCLNFGLRVKCWDEPAIAFRQFAKPSSGLSRPDFFDWPRYLRRDMANKGFEAVVMMTGANDAQDVVVSGRKLKFPTKAWLETYHERVAEVMDLILDEGVARLYWVGMPDMGPAGFGEKMATLDRVYQEEAALRAPRVEYFDSWKVLDSPSGGYVASYRQADGVHLNDAGSLKLGAAVLAQVKKDWHLR